jgi:hypothetical protein
MKTREKRTVLVIRCDVCKKEINGNYTSIMLLDHTVIDFCSHQCREMYEIPEQN